SPLLTHVTSIHQGVRIICFLRLTSTDGQRRVEGSVMAKSWRPRATAIARNETPNTQGSPC
ncbi:hypothetical protein SK128_022753, partial [Halocaridina rubra]